MKSRRIPFTPESLALALVSPSAVFRRPSDVVEAPGIEKSKKIEILKRWELDERALQRAADESMDGGIQPILDDVNEALAQLDPENKTADNFGLVPTKI